MNQKQIIDAFLDPDLYDHFVEQVEMVETHISWIFLTGSFAYKIKKPVDYGFLNFSTLEQREFYCHQELKLNRRFAPQIYLAVIAVTQSNNKIALAGEGEIIDYAIKMKQFDQNGLLNRLLTAHQIELHHIDDLSAQVAKFHEQIQRAGAELEFGSPTEVLKPVEENFTILNQLLKHDKTQLKTLHDKMISMYSAIHAQLLQRKQGGYIRECHGDLHLENIALVDNEILLFDGIEFNDSFRWIDTMSDCAFLIMDLDDHNYENYANHFLNYYLSRTGDYNGLSVLTFYKFYRATVRAKVAAINLQQHTDEKILCEMFSKELNSYLALAGRYSQPTRPYLAITHGLSGSGKSWVSAKLSDHLGAIWLRSDIERKRLFSESSDDLYSQTITEKTYSYLLSTSEMILTSGFPVIVDATFLDKKWRQAFRKMAQRLGIAFHILSCSAAESILQQRLKSRQKEDHEPSDADILVMQQQVIKREQLEHDESDYNIVINTGNDLNYKAIMEKLQKIQGKNE